MKTLEMKKSKNNKRNGDFYVVIKMIFIQMAQNVVLAKWE